MKKRAGIVSVLLAVFLFFVSGICTINASGASEDEVKSKGGKPTMEIQSSAFKEGGMIPKKHTCDGEDVSPALKWTAPPAGTKSLVLICDDPDAPVGTWVHWALFGLKPNVAELAEHVPTSGDVLGGAKQGRNDFGNPGYGGPCPPPGKPHRYFFKLYAVDIEPQLKVGATKADVMKAINGHVLAEAQLMGRYGR